MVYGAGNQLTKPCETMYITFRSIAVCLAVAVGAGLIGQLWVVALNAVSLSEAARGVLFLLVALGLMGQQRLSLVLAALLCLPTILTQTMTSPALLSIGQYVLLSLCLMLLIMHPHNESK